MNIKLKNRQNTDIDPRKLEPLTVFETVEGYIFMKILKYNGYGSYDEFSYLDLEDGIVYDDVENYKISRVIECELVEQ